MTTRDKIEDYVEYLVQHCYVRDLQDLSREERAKLSFLILVENNMYVKMIRFMRNAIKQETKKLNCK